MTLVVTDPHPVDRAGEILTPEALAFVEELHLRFAGTRAELLKARARKREHVALTGRPVISTRRPCRTAGSK